MTNDIYLAPVPRGMQHVAIAVIERELVDFHLAITVIDEPVEPETDEYCTFLQCRLGKQCGSFFDEQRLRKHVSVGYHQAKKIWSTSGTWEGIVWFKVETNAHVSKIVGIQVIGPLLASVHIWDLKGSSRLNTTIEEAVNTMHNLVKEDYTFDNAIDLWKRHAKCWPQDYKVPNILRYRASCIRGHSNEYSYTREDFFREVIDVIFPDRDGWRVDLINYDVEVVLLLLSPTCVALGLTLRPYQLLGNKAFQCNTMPPDISLPYLSGKITTGITRLRPSNAFLLLELAKIQKGDIILDPCCGIGTIPLNVKDGISIGGDLCLLPGDLAGIAGKYINGFGRTNPSTNLCAWDAAYLPIRSASIDIVISDFPFGKQCMSANKLYQVLPLWLGELARVLRPGTGRVVILCGAFGIVVDALTAINEPKISNWDVTSVFSVNIGGLLAWIVMAVRTNVPATSTMNHQRRLRKITAIREQTTQRSKTQTTV
jgi:Putative RNA methylase family UPF0020